MNGCTIRAVEDRDRRPVIAIFNHYVSTGFAAYPDTPVPFWFF
jgi:L-amino acid N-acyltransferase YncA